MLLENKIAIITGAANGIGRAAALRFAAEGADLTLCDLDREGLKKVAAQVEALGRRILALTGSVADRAFVDGMVADTVSQLGGLDILINNAGIVRDAIGHKMTLEQWDQVIEVNLTGAFNCLQAAMIYMRGRGSGAIVNVSSISRYGTPGQLNYAASKGGVMGLTRTAAKELGNKGVRVNGVAPGFIQTDMLATIPEERLAQRVEHALPMGRLGSPDEVAKVMLFLASDLSSFVTGQTMNVDGGAYMQ